MPTVFNALVMDLGGTNIRLGLLEPGQLRPTYIRHYEIDAYPSLGDVIQLFLSDAPTHQIEQAAIAVATPIIGDKIKLTNHNWQFSVEAIAQQFGFKLLRVINDFTALALSIPLLGQNELQQVGGEKADAEGAIALLGAGTGLGVSGLIRSAAGYYPISGEGGHVTLGARNVRELAIFNAFYERYGHMSAERLLSGTGLEEVYQVICCLDANHDEKLEPGAISKAAIEHTCPACEEVMQLFCEWFGIVSGDLALTLGASGGVYIGGGIVPKLGEYFVNSAFRSAFETKGRFSHYLSKVPVYIIHADNPALRGAAAALDARFDQLGLSCKIAH
ncbi:MAG: glucokinase [Proteobacteria bacterium]|nr:MAG: glucokinase [Pseudomonadota bacterium]